MKNNKLSKNNIKKNIKSEFIAKNIYYFSEIDSTNSFAAKLAQKGEKEGTLVIADKQNQGKGRKNRLWHSPAGTGLWFSLILRPNIKVAKSHFLTINASLAVYKALRNLGLSIDIKWPNDILYENKKLCGILSEMSASTNKLNYAITGIGINVNQKIFADEIKNKATSIYKIKKQKISRLFLLKNILINFEEYYKKFINGEKDKLLNEWKDKISLLGKIIIVKSDGKVYEGKAIDIAKDGRLMLLNENNKIIKFWAGDASIKY